MAGKRSLLIALALILSAVIHLPGPVRAGQPEKSEADDTNPELQNVLDKINEANRDLETVRADVLYTRSIPLLDDSETAAGSLSFQTPDKLNMVLKGERRHEEMVSDGRRWWVADHNAEQVEIYETDQEGALAEASFLQLGYGRGVEELREDFHIKLLSTEQVEREGEGEGDPAAKTQWRLRLEPKDPDSPARFERIEFRVTEGLHLPESFTLYESDGEFLHTFELENIRLNVDLEESVFEYAAPRGYTIIRP